MKISVLGKSGPSVVSLGLVCAKTPVDPPIAASTINNARKLIGISVSPFAFVAAAYHGTRIFRNPHACEYDMGSDQPELFAMSMQSVASPPTALLSPPKRAALAHIPGD